MPLGKDGCAAQGVGHASAARLCVCGHGEGVSRGGKARAARVPLRPWKPPRPPGHERGATHCVCVRHTARRTLRGVQLARQGLGAGRGREGSPHATLRRRRWATACAAPCACDRRAGGGRALEPKRCVVAAQPQVCGRGHCQRTKIKQLVFQSQARRSRRHASRLGPRAPRAGASAQRLARPVRKKEKKAAARLARAKSVGEPLFL